MLILAMIDWKQDCAALIPCCNEAESIGALIARVRQHLPHILVVDDGSTDTTASQALAAGAVVVTHSTNRGKGAALRTGFRQLQNDYSWVLTLDGDGQHDADDIPAFFRAAEIGQAELIIGNRFTQPQRIPWLRRRVNQWMTRRLARRSGVPLADSQCGFRLIKLAALAQFSLRCDHFEVESEITMAFAQAGRAITFVPIQVIYRSSGSKIRPLRDTWRWFRWWCAPRPTNPALPTAQSPPRTAADQPFVAR